RVRLHARERAAGGERNPDRPRARIELAENERPRERHQGVAAREGESAGGERPLRERTEDVLAVVRSGAFAAEEELEHLGGQSAEAGNDAEEQGRAAVADVEPERAREGD